MAAEPERASRRDEPIARLLRAARASKGWSQSRLQVASGLSRIDVYRFEAGIHIPSTSKALGLVVALDIPPAIMRSAIDGESEPVEIYISGLAAAGAAGLDDLAPDEIDPGREQDERGSGAG